METSSAAQEQGYIDTWKELLRGFAGMTGFAVFSHGSVVILKGAHHSEDAARAEALEVMKRYGPVFPGSEAGDFNTTPTKGDAWMVSGYHENLMTLVLSKDKDEVEITNPDSNMEVGIKGRGKRDQDSQDLKIVHVELTN